MKEADPLVEHNPLEMAPANDAHNVATATELMRSARHCLDGAVKYAFAVLKDGTHWCGELGSNASATAEFIFLRQTLGLDQSHDGEAFVRWFLTDQQVDGSWTLATNTPGHLSITAGVYLALKILGLSARHDAMIKAREYILANGGIEQVRVLTRFFFAAFGLFPWDALPELPVKVILLPSWSPINIYRLASWARGTTIPMTIISHHKPVFALPTAKKPSDEYLDELWLNPRDKNVHYTQSLADSWASGTLEFLSAVADKAIKFFGGLRSGLMQRWARREAMKWILQHQELEGDFTGIYAVAHPSVLALLLEGYSIEHPRVMGAFQAIESHLIHHGSGKRLQAVMSPVWDTSHVSSSH